MNWEQFRAILWLRWRLTRNQLTRGGGLNAAIASLAGVLLAFIALGASVGATLVGVFAFKQATAWKMMFAWDVITLIVLFLSLLGVATELQRSESIDLTRLLHLPVSLRQVFVLNYLVSLVSLGTVLALAVLLGLGLGLTIGRGPLFLLTVPLVLAFIFMLTAWIYCLRGWLLSLMVNPRRRRSIIVWVTLTFVLLGQAPQLINLAMQRQARRERAARRAAQTQSAHSQTNGVLETAVVKMDRGVKDFTAIAAQVHPWVPVLWLPHGTRGLAAGEAWPALWGSAGMFVLGWLGLGRAYRATLRFYRAEERVKNGKPPVAEAAKPARGRNWVEARLPWLTEDTAALALAQLRSMLRAPEVRMNLAMGLFAAILLPALFLFRSGSGSQLSEVSKPFVATGAVVMILFMLVQVVCNQFGWDRDGFRSLVLLPTPRDRLLFGKNLALLPLAGAVAFVPLLAVSLFAKLPALVALATTLQFCAAFLLFCTLGNFASILVPYRIAAGSLKPSKQSWQTALLLMLVHLAFPVMASPVFLPPLLGLAAESLGGWPAALVNLVAAGAMVVACGALYWFTLPALGRLMRRRETNILRVVTEAVD